MNNWKLILPFIIARFPLSILSSPLLPDAILKISTASFSEIFKSAQYRQNSAYKNDPTESSNNQQPHKHSENITETESGNSNKNKHRESRNLGLNGKERERKEKREKYSRPISTFPCAMQKLADSILPFSESVCVVRVFVMRFRLSRASLFPQFWCWARSPGWL